MIHETVYEIDLVNSLDVSGRASWCNDLDALQPHVADDETVIRQVMLGDN